MTAKIEVITGQRHILPLEKFINGRVNQLHANQLACRLLGRTNQSKVQEKDQKIMVAESPHMTYVGKNYGKSNHNTKSKTKHYVGVYDKKSGKMRVYDTELFDMQPNIPGQEKDESDSIVNEKTYKEKADMLMTAFGSSRRKRALDTRSRHAVDDAALTGALTSAIDQGVQEVQSYKQKTEEVSTDSELATIPPCNKGAERVEVVYNLSDILSPSDMDDLHNSATEFFNSQTDQIEAWRMEEKCMPSRLKDRLVSYIMVLALTIDEYNLSLSDLQKDLRIGRQKIMFYCRALGCKVFEQKVGEDKEAVAVLKLPLVFPSTGRKKKN